MNEFLAFVERFRPGYAATVRGAQESEIRGLENLAGRAMPAAFRHYLGIAGHDNGRLPLYGGEADFRFATLVRFCQAPTWKLPPNLVYIARDGSGLGMDLYLDTSQSGDDPLVLRMPPAPAPDEVETEFPSFTCMLYFLVFQELGLPVLAHRAQFRDSGEIPWGTRAPETRLSTLRRTAAMLGFSPVPHTGEWAAAYQRADAGITAYEPPKYGPTYSVAASDAAALSKIEEVLAASLGLLRVG
ncbi:MAG: hypothetical protein SFV51_23495 [Bryobacteraceae bacterium]|nr:hypothetical protein [Bryobacteraceae bacterium]